LKSCAAEYLLHGHSREEKYRAAFDKLGLTVRGDEVSCYVLSLLYTLPPPPLFQLEVISPPYGSTSFISFRDVQELSLNRCGGQ